MAHNVITDALVAPRIRFHLFRRKLTSNDARGATEAERECTRTINVPWEKEKRPQSPSLSRGRHDRGRRGMKEMERKEGESERGIEK